MSMASTGEPAPARRRRRLLIVDDESHLTKVLQMLLGEEHDVLVATSGAAALTRLEHDVEFDAIVCDLSMRDVSGMELHDWLAARRPDVARRMIFMTGGAYTPEARAFLDRVPNQRVEKPFHYEHLRSIVREVTER